MGPTPMALEPELDSVPWRPGGGFAACAAGDGMTGTATDWAGGIEGGCLGMTGLPAFSVPVTAGTRVPVLSKAWVVAVPGMADGAA